MKSKGFIISAIIVLIIVLVVLITFLIVIVNQPSSKTKIYAPQVNPNDFVSKIDNKYLTYTPGTKYIYKGETEDGTERTEVYVTDEIKEIMGVNTIVVWDRVFLEDELIEDTKDWFAQDKYGNVWYFGEDSKELEDGKIVSTEGSWEAGVDGAQPGIVMKANPKVGEIYRQEYYEGEAEDMAEIVSLNVKIKVKYGEFSNCLQTRDWNPLESGNDEYKYYCPDVNGLVYEVGIESGEGAQLIDIGT